MLGWIGLCQARPMRIGRFLAVLSITVLPVSATHAQEPSSASLTAAERMLADALLRHDRAAFVDMFMPDAVATFPTEKHGPEEIANLWIIFLTDPGTTMILAPADVSARGDTGATSGSLAVRGRTPNGVQTVPFGSYSLTWRASDGRWKISRLSGAASSPRDTADRGGVGPYRFGMSREEVSRVAECQPYTAVRVTGGLECPHYSFEGHDMNVSFLFGNSGLNRVQLWYYEGDSSQEAREAVGRVIAFLQRVSDRVFVKAAPNLAVTTDAVMNALNGAPAQQGRLTHVEIATLPGPQREVWFSRIGRSEYGYGVMLFADPQPAR
jgi:ketosteroid isomerase-like protein